MLQPRLFHILFFGLLSSLTIYSLNFSRSSVLPATAGRIRSNLSPEKGRGHVLVNQGAGFLGSHVALGLLEAGHVVTIVDDRSTASIKHLYKLLATGARLKVLSCDISSAQQLAEFLATADPPVDTVVHLADPPGKELAEPLQFLWNSTTHALALLKAVDKSTVSKLVLSSSYAVYGQQGRPSASPLAEDTADALPDTTHGHAALFIENAVRAYAAAAPGFAAVILRHGSIMGADPQARLGRLVLPSSSSSGSQQELDAISTCLSAAVQGLQQQPFELLVPSGSETPCFKEYVHVTDLAAAFVAALDKASNPPAVYNVGPGQPVTYMQVLEACQKVFGVSLQVTKQLLSSEGCHGVVGNVTKLINETGWSPKYQLEDALVHALQWQQSRSGNVL